MEEGEKEGQGEMKIKGGEEEEENKPMEVVLQEGEWKDADEASQHFIIIATRRDTCLQMITLYSFHFTALQMLAASMQIDYV